MKDQLEDMILIIANILYIRLHTEQSLATEHSFILTLSMNERPIRRHDTKNG